MQVALQPACGQRYLVQVYPDAKLDRAGFGGWAALEVFRGDVITAVSGLAAVAAPLHRDGHSTDN